MKLNEIFSKTAVTALALSLTLTTIATESSARTTTRGQAGPGGVLILFDAKTCIDPTKTYTNEGQIFSDLIFHSGGMKLCDSMLDILFDAQKQICKGSTSKWEASWRSRPASSTYQKGNDMRVAWQQARPVRKMVYDPTVYYGIGRCWHRYKVPENGQAQTVKCGDTGKFGDPVKGDRRLQVTYTDDKGREKKVDKKLSEIYKDLGLKEICRT